MSAPPPPRPRAPYIAPSLLLLSTALAMVTVHGWFRFVAGAATLVGAASLWRSRRQA